jgi:hypothetical protein
MDEVAVKGKISQNLSKVDRNACREARACQEKAPTASFHDHWTLDSIHLFDLSHTQWRLVDESGYRFCVAMPDPHLSRVSEIIHRQFPN